MPLTHTDWMSDNVLITPGGGKLIDWAWATPADAWTDPAFWLLRLMAHGHSARHAETVASRLPAYTTADPAHIDLFARASVRVRNEIEQNNPISQTKTMAASARAGAQHREGRLPHRVAPMGIWDCLSPTWRIAP